MDSPRSERSQTRFSTPVSDLDDHRHQASTRPRGDTIGSPQFPRSPVEGRHELQNMGGPQSPRSPLDGRHEFQDIGGGGRPELLQVNGELFNAGSISRDFEHAIIDDDKSGHGENIIERKGSFNPASSRRGTVRKSQNHPNRSRDSSTSSRSTSPANSVDAFADPRRRERANTIGSKAPSDIELGLQRTVSNGTHRRSRRPTFNSGSVRNLSFQDERASIHGPAEDDVCFPTPDESAKTYNIDFEELDEFVAETLKAKAHSGRGLRQKLSFSSQGNKPQVLNDLRYAAVPKIVTQSSSSFKVSSEKAIDVSDSVINCKDGAEEEDEDPLGANGPRVREHSLVGPTRYSFFTSEIESTIHAADFADLLSPGETCRDLFALPSDGGVWWLDILNPTEDELHVFQRAFGIHRLTTEDIITQEAREKVELFKQYYFVCFRSFFQMDIHSEEYMEPVNVYMVVFREGIITITYTQSPHAANVRKRIGKLRDYMALTADWICYAMIDNIVDTFGPPIHAIEIEADTIEDQVFVAREENFVPLLRQIGECRKKVMSLMRLLGGKADVIKGFAKRCNEQYSVTPRGEIGLYLGDIQDHVVTMMSNLGHFEKMLSRSHSNYLAQLSVGAIAQGNRANEVLSKITLVATVLVPLNLVTGLFGMNVPVPGKDSDGLGWFFGIIGFIIAFVVVILAFAKRYKFL